MSDPMTAQQILDREFLEIRAKILELAASFDRLQRGPGPLVDPRLDRLREALNVVSQPSGDHLAEQIQLIFSRSYDEQWRDNFGLPSGN